MLGFDVTYDRVREEWTLEIGVASTRSEQRPIVLKLTPRELNDLLATINQAMFTNAPLVPGSKVWRGYPIPESPAYSRVTVKGSKCVIDFGVPQSVEIDNPGARSDWSIGDQKKWVCNDEQPTDAKPDSWRDQPPML